MATPHDDDFAPRNEERVTVSRATLRLELLEMEVRLKEYLTGTVAALREDFNRRFVKIEDDVRSLEEANRLRDAATLALANETERRRLLLSEDTGRWSIRSNKVALILGVFAVGTFGVACLNAIHTILH